MSDAFTVFPALDLRNGHVVRLQYGDPKRQTTFGTDPVAMARRWLAAGARWLHVVNLDGAFGESSRANWEALGRLTLLPAHVQFGGGVRTADDIDRLRVLGVARIVLGTAAVENPDLIAAAISRHGAERIAVALDARDGIVQTHGWQTDGGRAIDALGRDMAAIGVTTVLHTDIGRDGVLTGVNWRASQALAAATGLRVIASGGVATLDDVTACAAAAGIAGVVTGRAIYDGRLDLAAAIAAVTATRAQGRSNA